VGVEFLLRLSQSPCAQILQQLSLHVEKIFPFDLKMLEQMEIFPVLRYRCSPSSPPKHLNNFNKHVIIRKLQLRTSIEWKVLKILSSKFPQLESLDISKCAFAPLPFAQILCERENNGDQIFPNLHSLLQKNGCMNSEDLSYLLQNRDGIENFRVVNVCPPYLAHSHKDRLAVRAVLWEK